MDGSSYKAFKVDSGLTAIAFSDDVLIWMTNNNGNGIVLNLANDKHSNYNLMIQAMLKNLTSQLDLTLMRFIQPNGGTVCLENMLCCFSSRQDQTMVPRWAAREADVV